LFLLGAESKTKLKKTRQGKYARKSRQYRHIKVNLPGNQWLASINEYYFIGGELMVRQIAIVVILIIASSTSGIAADVGTFKASEIAPAGTPLMLTGKLTKPQGNGPFPAIVLLHGCAGIKSYQDVWAGRFASWGYVAFQVDSLGPRGLSSICEDASLIISLIHKRTQDAYDAKTYLAGLDFVDRNRVGVMGWSHGGWTTISVVAQKRDDPFRSAIAFYPYCDRVLFDLNAPLLILIGEKDDWTLAGMCTMQMHPVQTGHEVILKIYPDAYHGFDGEGLDMVAAGHDGGHRILYNPAAAADANIRVREFLAKHLQ
jgi:dienelactone hydrolase